MSIYTDTLPPAFPHYVQIKDKSHLIATITDLALAGVSFAVTQDEPYRLWLSDVALQALEEGL